MNLFEFSQWVIETQGVVAFLLLVVIAQNYLYTKQLMKKNCELEEFLMDILRKELSGEHPDGRKN